MRSFRPALAVMALLVAASGQAWADDENFSVGASIGYSTRFERAVGTLDLLVHVNRSFTVVPTVSFTEARGVHRWTVGGELQWNAPVRRLHPRLMAWVGAGMVSLTEDPKGQGDATTRDLIAIAVAGVGYNAPAAPFLQTRVSLGGPAEVVIALGVRF